MTKEESLNKNDGFPEVHAHRKFLSLSQGLWILLTGSGIGWLAGLSVSPVAASIITSILGVAAGVVTGFQMIQRKDGKKTENELTRFIDPRPAALLVIGIALAVPCGIMVRTFHLLEPKQHMIYSNPLEPDSRKTTTVSEAGTMNRDNQDKGVFYSGYQDECEMLLNLASRKYYKDFIEKLNASGIPGAKEMVREYGDKPEIIEFFLGTICYHYKEK